MLATWLINKNKKKKKKRPLALKNMIGLSLGAHPKGNAEFGLQGFKIWG